MKQSWLSGKPLKIMYSIVAINTTYQRNTTLTYYKDEGQKSNEKEVLLLSHKY